MASEPEILDTPLLPPAAPTIRNCPAEYIKHNSVCFRFGSHSSYAMAKTACEAVGARLANIEPTMSKYIRGQVRTMGGNDFWIGSFVNKGRTYKQKGRTSCPIMRGQMTNDAFYGLVDCNSANRYICQKYGPVETQGTFNVNDPGAAGGLPNLPPTGKTPTTTEISDESEGGGMSPVIYVVITVVILIIAAIALKILIGKYLRDKRTKKKSLYAGKSIKKEIVPDQKGVVFMPKWRKNIESKTSSIDSAVPPSNPSLTPEKSHVHRHPRSQEKSKIGEVTRMGRPRVNGTQPTRKPPHINGDFLCSYHEPATDKDIYDKETIQRRHRRTYSDPRSDYSEHDHGRRHSRRRSYYSESASVSESDDSSYSGPQYGPTKVYQRHTSHSQMGREPLHYNMNLGHYGPPRRDYHHSRESRHRGRSRSRHRSNNGNVYYNDGHKERSGYISHKDDHHGNYGKNERVYSSRRQGHLPSVSARVEKQQSFKEQYFPQPHRLMSWTTPGELTDLSFSREPLVEDNSRSFPREPIRVSRQIHQIPNKAKNSSKKTKGQPAKSQDGNHLYESLDEIKRNKQLKKASQRNKSRKKRAEREMKRGAEFRESKRSVTSIQSRRLPTPPT